MSGIYSAIISSNVQEAQYQALFFWIRRNITVYSIDSLLVLSVTIINLRS
jgi:hypothetical protein